MSFAAGAFNRAYVVATTPAARSFGGALDDPRRTQLTILGDIVRLNRDCQFGRAHGFRSITGHSDFAERVPIVDYEDLRLTIDRIRKGEAGLLTHEPVSFLEPTGGSSRAAKLIPYTASLKRQIARSVHPWIRDLLMRRPELRNARSYWAVSPPVRRVDGDGSGVAVGAAHDLGYLPAAAASLMNRALALPRAASEIDELGAARYVTLRSLLVAEDLGLVSVWNPSFLTLLVEELDAWFEPLLHDLERGTISIELEDALRARLERSLPARPDVAARLRRRFGPQPPDDLGEMWTRLRVISCWTDGHAGRGLSGVLRRFPEVEIQGKGLIATEGVVSVPLVGLDCPVAATASHFLEFLPEGGGEARLVDELVQGETYEVVITTAGGLYRYRLKDIVRVEGYHRRAPLLRFVGRADGASDICGEKLTPAFVERALMTAFQSCDVRPTFALLSPKWGDPPHYDLWVDLDDSDLAGRATHLAAAVEAELRRGHHYDLCRVLGQLRPVRARSVADGERVYERACMRRGQRAGAVKPPALVADLGWSDHFEEVMS